MRAPMRYVGSPDPGPLYPVLDPEAAAERVAHVLARLDMGTDVGLDEQLTTVLARDWLDEAAARDLANETYHLYRRMADPSRTRPDKPVDPVVLRRALTLALTRPAEDPCWQDYQRINAALRDWQQSLSAEHAQRGGLLRLLAGDILRKVIRAKPDPAAEAAQRVRDEARFAPVAAAEQHFRANWRHS